MLVAYSDFLFIEVFVNKSLQRNGTDRGINIVTFESCVRDKRAYVFFKFSQEGHYVVFSKLEVLVVTHFCRD